MIALVRCFFLSFSHISLNSLAFFVDFCCFLVGQCVKSRLLVRKLNESNSKDCHFWGTFIILDPERNERRVHTVHGHNELHICSAKKCTFFEFTFRMSLLCKILWYCVYLFLWLCPQNIVMDSCLLKSDSGFLQQVGVKSKWIFRTSSFLM